MRTANCLIIKSGFLLLVSAFPESEVIVEQSALRLANRIILGITQGVKIGVVDRFQGGKLFSVFQGLLILARRKRFRDGDIGFVLSLSGRSFGNIIFSITGLDDYRNFLSGSDLVCV